MEHNLRKVYTDYSYENELTIESNVRKHFAERSTHNPAFPISVCLPASQKINSAFSLSPTLFCAVKNYIHIPCIKMFLNGYLEEQV